MVQKCPTRTVFLGHFYFVSIIYNITHKNKKVLYWGIYMEPQEVFCYDKKKKKNVIISVSAL